MLAPTGQQVNRCKGRATAGSSYSLTRSPVLEPKFSWTILGTEEEGFTGIWGNG
jgi:hypothetical protein